MQGMSMDIIGAMAPMFGRIIALTLMESSGITTEVQARRRDISIGITMCYHRIITIMTAMALPIDMTSTTTTMVFLTIGNRPRKDN